MRPPSDAADDRAEPNPRASLKFTGLRGLSLLGLSNLLVKPLWFLFLIAACPRVLGPSGYGEMQTALALSGLVIGLTDLGLSNFTLREVARNPSRGGRFFLHVVPYRVVAMTSVALGVLFVGGALLPVSAGWSVLAGAAAYVVASSLGSTMAAFYRAYGRLEAEAIATACERVATIAAGVSALLWVRTADGVLFAMAAASSVAVTLQGVWISRNLARPASAPEGFESVFLRSLVWLALPLGISDLFQSFYMRSSQLAVDGLLGAAAAGQYAQAARVVEMCSLLPALVAQGYIFSRLSSLEALGEHATARVVLRRGAVALAGASVLVAVALSVSAPLLIRLLSGGDSFARAAEVLRVIVWAFPFTCLKDVYYVAMLSKRRHLAPTLLYGATAIMNVSLLVWLVPLLGLTAAAGIAVAAEAFAALGMALVSRRPPPATSAPRDSPPRARPALSSTRS